MKQAGEFNPMLQTAERDDKPRPGRLDRTALPWLRPGRFDLASIPWLRPLIESRWPLFLARSLTLAGFVFTILAGLFGPAVGSHNFAIIFVWIAWWTALKLVFIPLGGRSWCSVCPLPMPGEWLQQGSLLGGLQKPRGLGLRWPKRLRGAWLQSGAFLLIGLFSAVTLTNGRLTAWVLLGLILGSAALSLVFERRAFCSYICPIGGFTAPYARFAPVEVRVKSSAICAAHSEKTCYQACPWGQYPLAMRDSAQCGLCMECLRVCPSDNIALSLRPFGSDLGSGHHPKSVDEAALALVMLGSALAFSAVFTGPWGWLKTTAYQIGSLPWLGYAAGFLALNLLLLPGSFAAVAWLQRRLSASKAQLSRVFAQQAQALYPLGLFTWIAFTVSFAFPKFNLVADVLADPLGLGWEIPGLAALNFEGLQQIGPGLQAALLLAGLVIALRLVRQLVQGAMGRHSAAIAALPVSLFCVVYTGLVLWLLVG
jgi:ferredoxin